MTNPFPVHGCDGERMKGKVVNRQAWAAVNLSFSFLDFGEPFIVSLPLESDSRVTEYSHELFVRSLDLETVE